MSMDLIISDAGKVLIASNRAFAAEVSRVDFDVQSRLLTINYANDAQPAEPLPLAVNAAMTPALLQAPRVLLVAVDNSQIIHGFDVPLTCIEM